MEFRRGGTPRGTRRVPDVEDPTHEGDTRGARLLGSRRAFWSEVMIDRSTMREARLFSPAAPSRRPKQLWSGE